MSRVLQVGVAVAYLPRPVGPGSRSGTPLRGARADNKAVAQIVPRSPGPGEDLVGPPAEQERVGALVDLFHDRAGLAVEVGPSAALESAALVLFRPAGSLYHAVNGDHRGGRQFHGRSSLLAGFVVARFHRTAAPISRSGRAD